MLIVDGKLHADKFQAAFCGFSFKNQQSTIPFWSVGT
jgi:hypothetical protein